MPIWYTVAAVSLLAIFAFFDIRREIRRSNFRVKLRIFRDPKTGRAEIVPEDEYNEAPLAKRPPNIGGIDHPPYMGPNYVEAEELAEELRHLPHYYTGSVFDDRPNTLYPVRLQDQPFFETPDEEPKS